MDWVWPADRAEACEHYDECWSNVCVHSGHECYFCFRIRHDEAMHDSGVCEVCQNDDARDAESQLTPLAKWNRKHVIRGQQGDPAWERGRAGEHRPGGFFAPYMKPNGDRIGLKEFAEKRSVYEPEIRKLKSSG